MKKADLTNPEYVIFPGFCDVHVHFREPGFSYKETIASGSLAAAAGGYTAVCTMPNLNPVPDSPMHLSEQIEIIRRDARIDVRPFAAITIGEGGKELTDMEALAADVCGFSDDGKGVESDALMREAMERAKKLNRIISAHCEFKALSNGGVIHDGKYAAAHGLPGISSESEWRPIERDLKLARETGCSYHVCHISCRESVELIRQAKREGVDVTCETAPHYLLLTEDVLSDEGRFKMAPPLRTEADREALIEGLSDGTIDMIATDHAPHSVEEKGKGLSGSAFGIVGLETAFPLLYTELVKKDIISLEKLIDLMAVNPRKRFGLPVSDDDYTVYDLTEKYTVDPENFLTMGRATPFSGREVYGKCMKTVYRGKTVYEAEKGE